MAPKSFGTIPASQGLTYWYNALTDGTATQLSGGRIPKMTPVQASSFLGSMTGEHGKLDWNNLDVVEMGSGRGRGASQYTGVRRTPYDAAVNAARAAGKDPNSAQWQFEYFINEYKNKDLIGWTRVFEKMPQFKNVQEGVMYFTGSAQKGKGYFRPDERSAHYDKRTNYGQQIYSLLGKPQTPATPAAQPAAGTPAVDQNILQKFLNKLGINGGKQSFNTEKLGQVIGEMANNPNVKSDVGLAIFASSTNGNAINKWNSLDKASKQAWRTVGGELGIQQMMQNKAPSKPFSLPKTTGVGASQYNPVTKTNLSIRGSQPGDLNYGTSRTQVGGLPGLKEIAQAGIANYGAFKNKSSGYGATTFGMSNSTVGRINSRSYGTPMNLGRSLGINTAATAAAGTKYGGAAMSMNTSANVAASYGKQ